MEEMEELGLGSAILKGKTGEYINTGDFIKEFRK